MLAVIVPLVISSIEIISTKSHSVRLQINIPNWAAVLFFIFYLIVFSLIIGWVIKQVKRLLNLKEAQRKSELLHLQSQVNPHFFFNMLNNLYGLVDQNSEKAKQLILKLSDLMRYSIYEGEKTKVTLSEEVKYLENYIELHLMRYHKTVGIQFNSDIKGNDYAVMPLLFIILLENAFKHGVENLTEKAYVHVNLSALNNIITFEIENNFDEEEVSKTNGIGLKNLKRRLKLAYPSQHDLTFTSQESVYKVKLELRV